METSKLKKFAQFARRNLMEQVAGKLKLVLAEGSAARRENPEAIKNLEEQRKEHSDEQVIEKVAYTWFNRFCALRFMDVNRYTRIGVLSPVVGQFQPEILAEAKTGHIDEEMAPEKIRQQVFALLEGSAPSNDPQAEAYRLLVVAVCNYYSNIMPFLFERIADYTELLMPDDLLSGSSILAYTREAMTPDACQDVEVIGWLYQFYISEKKDKVFDGMKKNKKISPENIPAATQLFTPHWIVRYLVENTLGRLWMLNRPASKLIERMEYYIKPEQHEIDFLHISKPEEIKICDPACGSGHMLTYAFDLLYAIYEEEGYEPTEIPEKILTYNLYGIEIDERAGELAAFALTMKTLSALGSSAKQRRSLRTQILPNICVLKNVKFDESELNYYIEFVGRNLFTAPLLTTLRQFEEADNFGSLIRPDVTDVAGMMKILELKNVSSNLFLSLTHQKVMQALQQADYLTPKYHVVIANPPYMGGKGMNGRLGAWLKDNYTDVKSDLFSAFIVRNTELALPKGQLGFMSPFVWMFISSYEKMRNLLINQKTITSLIQLEYSGFDGATVPICTFTLENSYHPEFKGGYVRLSDFRGSENQAPKTLEAINNPNCGWFYRASAADFTKIPGNPIAYWVPKSLLIVFEQSKGLGYYLEPREGLTTGNNDAYVRFSWELSRCRIGRGCADRDEAEASRKKWFPFNKGGDYRKWFGNDWFVVNWEDDGKELQNSLHPSGERIWAHNFNLDYIFKPSVSWSDITTRGLTARLFSKGFLFDATGLSAFERNEKPYRELAAAICNSKIGSYLAPMLNPTMHFKSGDFAEIPLVQPINEYSREDTERALEIAIDDWDAYETSWDFTSLPLLQQDYRQPTLKATYQKLRAHWWKMMLEMQCIEEENNRIFIEAYSLKDELTPEVPLSEITLTCNPHYRYDSDKCDQELEALLLADTMRELISYAVGCMFGRYALEKPGLILANQGEMIEDYLERVPEPSFPADDDNVIPMLDGEWFTDDIAERFRKLLRIAFGEEHYEANLTFIEMSLGKNGKTRDIRDYFLKDFYSDHVRRYKKRPIYWLFSSPKGSFNALIYMHRYRPDTVSVVLNDYLREFRSKLTSQKNHLEAVSISASASQGEKTRALKEIEQLRKILDELETYEHDTLYPLATQQVEIDLDDGVKVNYLKFGSALKKIPGLDAQED